MKLCSTLSLRKIGSKFMIVRVEEGTLNMTEVFSLNETAAALWQYAKDRDFSVEELVDWVCETYDVQDDVARRDVLRQLKEWKEYGLLIS